MLTPRISPKTLNEWTLELNLVRELSALFDTPFGILYPLRLRNIFDIKSLDISKISPRKTKVEKLTPIEEARGGGWDLKFSIPNSNLAYDRLIYLQVKRGDYSDGTDIDGSIFNKSIQNPNPHVAFGFNNNTRKNQHLDLQNLAAYLEQNRMNPHAVLYAFPRLTHKDEFETLSEPLIFYTSFISVSEMDAFAAKNDIIIQAGDTHTFRTHKTDESKAEITSSPFALDTTYTTYHFILEVFKLKIYHFWNTYIPYFNETRLEDLITLQLASILKVNPYSINENALSSYSKDIKSELVDYYDKLSSDLYDRESFMFKSQWNSLKLRNALFDDLYHFVNSPWPKYFFEEVIAPRFTSPILSVAENIKANQFVSDDFSPLALVL